MKKIIRFCFFALLFSLLALPLFASPHAKQDLVPVGHWVYDALTALSMEEGHVSLADQAPISVAEVDALLSEVNYEKLSDAGKNWYDKLVEWRGESNWALAFGHFSIGVAPTSALEVYGKTDKSIDWAYDRYQRQHLLDVPFRIQAGDFVTMEMLVDLGANKTASDSSENFLNIPVSLDFSKALWFDTNFPHWAYLSTGYPFTESAGLNFQMGLGSTNIGRSLTGSMIWNYKLTDLSFANLEFYSPSFRYNMNVSQFNVNRYVYSHRFDFRLFKKFEFSIMESLLVYAPLELRFLNPFTILHGLAPWRDYHPNEGWAEDHIIMDMTLKFVYTPFKYTRFYFYYAQTENQMPNEDSNRPAARGFQWGGETYIPLGTGYMHVWAEGSYADPFLFMKESPNWSLVRTYTELVDDSETFYEWFASPFGPDTVTAQLNVGYEVPLNWSVTLSYLFAAKGEFSGTDAFASCNWGGLKLPETITGWVYEISPEAAAMVAPHGIPEYVNRISVRGEWYPFEWLKLVAQPSLTFVANHNHIQDNFACGLEGIISAKIEFTKLWKPKVVQVE